MCDEQADEGGDNLGDGEADRDQEEVELGLADVERHEEEGKRGE